MQPNQSFVLSHIYSTFSRGKIFFASDLSTLPFTQMEVRTYLAELVKTSHIVRLARGVYLFPRLSEVGMKIMLPETADIAKAIASHEGRLIAPSPETCAFRTGLVFSDRAPYKFLVTGSPRKIHLQNGRLLEFVMTREARIFSIRSEAMRNLTLAIRYLGKDAIGERELSVIALRLSEIKRDDIEDGIWKTTEWVREVIWNAGF